MSCLMSASDGKTDKVNRMTIPPLPPPLLHPFSTWSDGEDERQQDGGELRLMERGVTGRIDHSATSWLCWSVLIFSLSFFLILVGHGHRGTDRTGDRQRKEKQEVVITTPWPPGSPGLRWSLRWPLCPPCFSCSSCVCASGGCRPPRCRAFSCYCC